MRQIKLGLFFVIIIGLIISCKPKHDIDSGLRLIRGLKSDFSKDSIFKKSPLNELVAQVDYIYTYYYHLIDTIKDTKEATIINEYSHKFLDIDSIIDVKTDNICLIDSLDSRESIKLKILDNEITLLKRIKHYYDNQSAIKIVKIVRVCPTIKKGSWKKIIVFVPDSNKIVANSDTGYFYGIDKFVLMKEKADLIDNDSISISIHDKKYIVKFDIY